MVSLTVNGKAFSLSADPDVPLLWVLRDDLKQQFSTAPEDLPPVPF